MKPDFSEFSYGYALTEELVRQNRSAVIAAPTFPSLFEEGKSGGYDVKVPLSGTPVFLQFKLSDRMERETAKEHKNNLLSVPYYRMHLRPTRHSDQHNLLMQLEATGETVLYIAPEFHLPGELNLHYLNKTVISNSAAFSPTEIGTLPTDGPHYVAFERGASHAYRCSNDPKKIVKATLLDGLLAAAQARGARRRRIGQNGLRLIADRMLESLEITENRLQTREKSVDIAGVRKIVEERPTFEAVGYMARTFFDAELVVIK